MSVVVPRRELPPALRALFPFAPHWTTLPDGERVHHVEDGEGEPVVLVHGNPTWSFLWRAFLGPVARAGRRALAFDHVGFGLSDHPEDPAYYSLARHVANMDAWARANRLADVTLVVHDWGGPIGLGWAGRNPRLVKRVVILNTLAFAPRRARPLTAWHAFFAGPLAKLLGQDLNLVVRSAMRFGVAKRLRPEVRKAYLWPFPTSASRVGPRRFVAMVPDGPDHPEAAALRDVEAGLAALADKPALVVWGDRDPVMPPRHVERWRKALPRARVEHVPRASHFLQEDAPDAVVDALVRFLHETR